MKHPLVSAFLWTILFLTVAVSAQQPSYQHIHYVEVPIVEINVQETNTLRQLEQKIYQIFQDIDAVCTQNADPFEANRIIERKYLRNDRAFANYSGTNKWSGSVYQAEVYPLETNPDYFMNYSVQPLPANYDSSTATFPPQQTILKLIFSVYTVDQIETIKTPPAYSIIKASQVSTPLLTKTVYVGLPHPILNRKELHKIQIQNELIARQRMQRTASSARIAVIGILLALVVLFFFALVLVGIVVALSTVKKEKREHIRISREAKKIDAMVAAGRITSDEGRELKKAFGPAACAEVSREPDLHLKIVGTVHIVASVFKLLLLVMLFLGLGMFSLVTPFASHDTRGHIVLLPLLLIIIAAVVFLAVAAFHIIAAVKLMKGAPWARIVIIVFSILGILSFPVGTAVGVYSLWVLLFRENAGLYFISDNT